MVLELRTDTRRIDGNVLSEREYLRVRLRRVRPLERLTVIESLSSGRGLCREAEIN